MRRAIYDRRSSPPLRLFQRYKKEQIASSSKNPASRNDTYRLVFFVAEIGDLGYNIIHVTAPVQMSFVEGGRSLPDEVACL